MGSLPFFIRCLLRIGLNSMQEHTRNKHVPLWAELNKTKKGAIDKMAILGIVFLVIGVYLILDSSKK